MPVIIKEKRTIAGKEYDNMHVYKSDKPVTKEGRTQAEKLDNILNEKMSELEKKMIKNGLIKLKNRKGVVELWYNVGKGIEFVNDTEIVPREDRKYIWRALYDHIGELSPGKLNERVLNRTSTSHFRYCNIISHYDWFFVRNAGNWTAWVEFLDSPVIRNDARIIDWLGTVQLIATGSVQDWLRKLTREIRHTFKNKDSSVFSDDEIHSMLENVLKKVYPEH